MEQLHVVDRLHDFLNLCVERLQNLCAWRGCVIFLSHSLTHSGCLIYFCGGFFAERLRDFFVERLRDLLYEEVA